MRIVVALLAVLAGVALLFLALARGQFGRHEGPGDIAGEERPDEPIAELIEDPWLVHACPGSPSGCSFEFEDPDFPLAQRETVYYVRALEEPSPAVNAANLRCERDEQGRCLRSRPCYADERTPRSDDCLAEIEERAWSSPIWVSWNGP